MRMRKIFSYFLLLIILSFQLQATSVDVISVYKLAPISSSSVTPMQIIRSEDLDQNESIQMAKMMEQIESWFQVWAEEEKWDEEKKWEWAKGLVMGKITFPKEEFQDKFQALSERVQSAVIYELTQRLFQRRDKNKSLFKYDLFGSEGYSIPDVVFDYGDQRYPDYVEDLSQPRHFYFYLLRIIGKETIPFLIEAIDKNKNDPLFGLIGLSQYFDFSFLVADIISIPDLKFWDPVEVHLLGPSTHKREYEEDKDIDILTLGVFLFILKEGKPDSWENKRWIAFCLEVMRNILLPSVPLEDKYSVKNNTSQKSDKFFKDIGKIRPMFIEQLEENDKILIDFIDKIARAYVFYIKEAHRRGYRWWDTYDSTVKNTLKNVLRKYPNEAIPLLEFAAHAEGIKDPKILEEIDEFIQELDPEGKQPRLAKWQRKVWKELPEKETLIRGAQHAGKDVLFFLERGSFNIDSDKLVLEIMEHFLSTNDDESDSEIEFGSIDELTELGVLGYFFLPVYGREGWHDNISRHLSAYEFAFDKVSGYPKEYPWFITHLIHNAIHAGRKMAISIRKFVTQKGTAGYKIVVWDNGPGIDNILRAATTNYTSKPVHTGGGGLSGGFGMVLRSGESGGGSGLPNFIKGVLEDNPRNKIQIESGEESWLWVNEKDPEEQELETTIEGTRIMIDYYLDEDDFRLNRVAEVIKRIQETEQRPPTIFEIIRETNYTLEDVRELVRVLNANIIGEYLEEAPTQTLFEQAI